MATIYEVAMRAGVSPATVSKVLSNKPYVSAATRARVEQAIAELNYVPSRTARGLSVGRAFILGLLVPSAPDQIFADPHLLECMRGIEAIANTRDYNLLLSTSRTPADAASAGKRLLRSNIIDGAIVVETLGLHEFSAALGQQPYPWVVIGYPLTGAQAAIHAADYDGAVCAMQHLLSLGHRRIGIVSGHERPFALDERLRGVRAALEQAGMPFDPALFAMMDDLRFEDGYAAGCRLLERSDRPGAIFALTDRLALGVLRRAAELGLETPGDLSLVGFDDIAPAAYATPPLTTVRQPGFALGEAAAQAIFTLLDGGQPAATTVIATELIIRGSTAPPD